METNDEATHARQCGGCELCETFKLASRLLDLVRDPVSDLVVEMNALIVAAGYNAGREGDSLESALDAFRYAYVLGRRERARPDGPAPQMDGSAFCATPVKQPQN
jgi:hypothetical protein